ncbi:RecBCD enzyme subunit RecD [Desulfosarcina alkanivorans]|uniref:RecBCD enzyme subunit RecD n=1 Tax=Desulfosarcina alkanivorans TaxID=571177 RepID=A0A5K7YDB6_9BACT|nr:exodeoxyribonuclease V subunit alpha [Desulfosarcina alkanivorans]BBO67138.1 RecBCD enzyme subunit RecD [Desulfosarcina alkanivorans]
MVNGLSDPQIDRLRRFGIAAGSTGATALRSLLADLDLSDLDLMTIRDLARYGPEPDDGGLVAMLGLMFAALGEGSLCLDLDMDRLREHLLKAADPAVTAWVARFMRRLENGDYDALIDRAGGGFKPLVLDDATGHRLLYFQKFHFHEQRLKQRLFSFLSHPGGRKLSDDAIVTAIDSLYRDEAVIRKEAGGDPIVRDPCQLEAIRAALKVPILVVSGGPGTGKTSLLVNLLRAMVRTGTDPSRIKLAAPTGRAAQRMTEALVANLATIAVPDSGDRRLGQLSGSTLHKLLVVRSRNGGFLYGARRSIPAEVVVLDEVSMVDVVMMDRLFQAIDPDHTRLILLGDKDQLPSVEAGSVLADMSPDAGGAFVRHFVVLRNVYRASGELLKLAQAINSGRSVPLRPVGMGHALNLKSGQWAFVSAGDGDVMNRHLDHWVMHQYVQKKGAADSYVDLVNRLGRPLDPPEAIHAEERNEMLALLFDHAVRCRILTVLRHGRTGARSINDRIAAGLRRILDPGRPPESRLFNGALLMITRNDYTRDLYNGDVGVVLRQADGSYRAGFKRAGGVVWFPASALSDWDLAFAMTVHKSQGSEFNDTLLCLPDDAGHRLLTREIIYTAATRASRRLIVYGTAAAFQTALKRKVQRQSGLMH